MVIFEATFKKTDGKKRKMRFARLDDLPKNIRNTNIRHNKTNIAKGMELVWDTQKHGYRWFNWNSVVGKVIAKSSV